MRKADLQYLSYVLRHKWFVFQAGLKTGAPLWRLIKHDWSKFKRDEWVPYREFFYGGEKTPARKQAFADAFRLHCKRNDHHWNCWVIDANNFSIGGRGWERGKNPFQVVRPMSDDAIKEMVADWMGAGRAITGNWDDIFSWYERTKSTQTMTASTRWRVEQILGSLKKD